MEGLLKPTLSEKQPERSVGVRKAKQESCEGKDPSGSRHTGRRTPPAQINQKKKNKKQIVPIRIHPTYTVLLWERSRLSIATLAKGGSQPPFLFLVFLNPPRAVTTTYFGKIPKSRAGRSRSEFELQVLPCFFYGLVHCRRLHMIC